MVRVFPITVGPYLKGPPGKFFVSAVRYNEVVYIILPELSSKGSHFQGFSDDSTWGLPKEKTSLPDNLTENLIEL